MLSNLIIIVLVIVAVVIAVVVLLRRDPYALPDKIEARVTTESSKETRPLYGTCAYCGKRVYLPYKCTYCGKLFCDDHRLPFHHNCSGMESYKASKPPGGGRIIYRKR